MTAAVRMAIRRRSGRACSACRPTQTLAPRVRSAILDRGGLDLDIAREVLGERRVGDGDFLADELVRPVLARGLDADRISAGAERIALVVLAVPGDCVLPRWTGRARDRVDQIGFLGLPADLIGVIPALQVGVPTRAGLPGHEPQCQRSGRETVLVLNPDGDIGAS